MEADAAEEFAGQGALLPASDEFDDDADSDGTEAGEPEGAFDIEADAAEHGVDGDEAEAEADEVPAT